MKIYIINDRSSTDVYTNSSPPPPLLRSLTRPRGELYVHDFSSVLTFNPSQSSSFKAILVNFQIFIILWCFWPRNLHDSGAPEREARQRSPMVEKFW